MASFVYERRRPNGTVLEYRTALLPSGGIVRTYNDITERKNNEIAVAKARTSPKLPRASAPTSSR